MAPSFVVEPWVDQRSPLVVTSLELDPLVVQHSPFVIALVNPLELTHTMAASMVVVTHTLAVVAFLFIIKK